MQVRVHQRLSAVPSSGCVHSRFLALWERLPIRGSTPFASTSFCVHPRFLLRIASTCVPLRKFGDCHGFRRLTVSNFLVDSLSFPVQNSN